MKFLNYKWLYFIIIIKIIFIIEQDKENDSRNAQATQAVIQRRRRPKRRSTGVVHVDMDVSNIILFFSVNFKVKFAYIKCKYIYIKKYADNIT